MGINLNKNHKISKVQITTESGTVIEIHPLAGTGLLELIKDDVADFMYGRMVVNSRTDFKITGIVGAHRVTLPAAPVSPISAMLREVSLSEALDAYIVSDNKWVHIKENGNHILTLPTDKITGIWQEWKAIRRKIKSGELSGYAVTTGQLNTGHPYSIYNKFIKVGCKSIAVDRVKRLVKTIKYFTKQKEK